VLLTFYRHVACPISHLRFRELSRLDHEFRKKGLIVLAVFESSRDNLIRYSEDEQYYARPIPNPEFDLYERYDIELNTLKILFSMYKGAPAKSIEGKRQFKHRFEPEGHPDLLGGDFLIGEDGFLKQVHYNQFLGGHLSVVEIRAFLNNPTYKEECRSATC